MSILLNTKNQFMKMATAYWILAGSLIITLIFSLSLIRADKQAAEHSFDEQVNNLLFALDAKMKGEERILNALKGLYAASESVSRDEFRDFVNSLHLSENYVGVLGVGYADWVAAKNLPEYLTLVSKDGFPNHVVRPEGERASYTPVTYIEPFEGRNLAAFGFDMYSESVRRAAMDYAVINNVISITSKVTLVQENQQKVQAGLLMYSPVYKHNHPLNTVENRWAALQGFVYIPSRMGDLIQSALQDHYETIHLKLYAGKSANPETLLFDSAENLTSYRIYKTKELSLYGQSWFFEFSDTPAFNKERKYSLNIMIIILGVVSSILLFLVFKSLAVQRQRAIHIAEAMTKDVNEKNKQLKLSDERFRLALESAAMGVWSWHLADNVIQWDASMFSLFGEGEQKSLNSYESFLSHLHDEDRDRVFDEVAQAIEGNKGFDTEYRVVWPDRSIHFIAARAKIVFDEGVAVSLIGTCWDVTERKRLDKLKTEFVSTVSHELRTPLTAVTGALGLAVSGAIGELPEKAKVALDIAYKNAQRLKLLINDLLDMDKLLAGKLEFHCEPQLLLPLLKRAVTENQAYADQFNVRYAIAPIDPTYKINVEESRFLQVMANYLSNAAKFSKANSDVIVSVSKYKNFLRVAVSDNGPGIAADAQGHIFEKFYQVDSSDTRKKGGTGLGLAITKEIVERMGGHVGFMSDVGLGSTFYADFVRADV